MFNKRAAEAFGRIGTNGKLAAALGLPFESNSDKMVISRLRGDDIRPRQIYAVACLIEADPTERRGLLLEELSARMRVTPAVLMAVACSVVGNLDGIRACIAGALLPYPADADAEALADAVREIAAG
mgnify:FL=1